MSLLLTIHQPEWVHDAAPPPLHPLHAIGIWEAFFLFFQENSEMIWQTQSLVCVT